MPPSKSTHVYKVVLLYIIFGSVWILLSDLVAWYLTDQGFSIKHLQMLKGIFYIMVTAAILYFLLLRDYTAIDLAWKKLSEEEQRYRTAFANTPHPLWEVDLSQLKAYVDNQSPVSRLALQEQVAKDAELREQCFSRIKVIEVNESVYTLFGASYDDGAKPPCAKLFMDKQYTFLRRELEALSTQKNEFASQQHVVPHGFTEEISLSVHWMVMPGHEKKYDRVLISAFDITGLEALIKKLKASESKYRNLTENTSEAVLVVDTETIFFANRKAKELFGITVPEDLTTELSTFIQADDRAAFFDALRQCFADRQNSNHVFRIVDGMGNIRWGACKFSLTDWEKDTAILVLIVDITEMSVKENQVRQAKLLLEKVFESLSEAIFVIDSENRNVIICNRAAEEVFGYRREEMNGRSTRQLHVDDKNFVRFGEISEEVLKKGKVFHASYTMRHKDGHEIFTENTVAPIDDLAGWTHGVISVISDVTKQKQFEEALKDSERKYKCLLEDAKEGIIVLQNDNIAFVNRQMEHILGYDGEKLLGSHYLEYVHSDEREEVSELYRMVMLGKVFPPDTEIKIINSQRDVRWLRVNAVKVEWEHEPAVMALVMDISEQKSLQERTEEMEARIVQAQKLESIGTLAGGIAHDFNNILSAILGFTELAIKETKQNTNLRNDLEEVYTAGIRAKKLVKQILAFSRQADYERQPLQISTVIKEVIKFLRSSIPTSIALESDIQSEALIMGDPTQIHQVVMNLCTNSVQAMEGEKGKVQISVKDMILTQGGSFYPELPEGNYIQVQIVDNGRGIKSENIDKIFEPYFTTKEIGEGTGLGLSLVFGIIESYGGKITVQSKPGAGSIFTILLPTIEEEVIREIERDEEIPRGHERILVVDDEDSIVKMLKSQLSDLGYRVTVRTDSLKALEQFQAKPAEFDLVITDMTMPNMSGDELADEISSLRPDIPIIICTGFSRKISSWNPADVSADELLIKPITKADLARVVRKLLDKKGE